MIPLFHGKWWVTRCTRKRSHFILFSFFKIPLDTMHIKDLRMYLCTHYLLFLLLFLICFPFSFSISFASHCATCDYRMHYMPFSMAFRSYCFFFNIFYCFCRYLLHIALEMYRKKTNRMISFVNQPALMQAMSKPNLYKTQFKMLHAECRSIIRTYTCQKINPIVVSFFVWGGLSYQNIAVL